MRAKQLVSKTVVLATVMAMTLQMIPINAAHAVTNGAYIVGDGSGGGGGGSQGSAGAGGAGGNGGSSDSTITGTVGDDVIFGDGSGGGAGCRSVSYSVINTRGGFGGSGDDSITGGDGDDVIFGDGFNGQSSTGWGGGKGGLGGGGGGATGGQFGTAPNAGPGGIGGGGGGGGRNTDNATYGLGGATAVTGVGSSGGNGGSDGGNSATSDGAVTGSGGVHSVNAGGGGGGFGGAAGGAGGQPGASGANGSTGEHRYTDGSYDVRDYFDEATLRSVLTNYPNFGAGDDTISGGSGSNELFGLGGNNVFIVDSDDSATANRIWDFKAGDKLLLRTSGVTTSTVEVDTVLTGATIADYDGDGDSDDTRFTFAGAPIDLINIDSALESVDGEIMSPNNAPTITLDDNPLNYTVNASAVQVDSTGTVNDPDGDSNWNNGTLSIRISDNAHEDDTLTISDTNGTGPAIAVVSGTTILRSDGTNVGTLSHTNGTVDSDTTMTITFESTATNTIVQEVMRSLRFATCAAGDGTRTVTIAAEDYASASGEETRTISVVEAPTFVSAETNVAGTQITATFDKDMMADPSGKEDQFDVQVDGDEDAVDSIANTGDDETFELTLDTTVTYGQIVTIAYTAGNVIGADDSTMATFGAESVTNNVPEPDETTPTVGGSGIITADNPTQSTIDLSWTAATDDVTTQTALQYKVVYSLSDNIDTTSSAETSGTTVQDWDDNITSAQATGLSEDTTYYFNVIVKDEAGNKAVYTTEQQATSASSSGNGGSSSANTGAEILVNGKTETAGTQSNTTQDGKSVTTIVVDSQKLEQKLEQEGNNAVVTIPINTNSDIAVGELNGQMVKNMENRKATVEIKTAAATYTLPALQINIDAISKKIGTNVQLADIKVHIEIAKTGDDIVKVTRDSAIKGSFSLVVSPLDFNVTCTSNNKTVDVDLFNEYVSRTVALPADVDPNKITTGIVVEADGAVRHVPTKIIVVGGKYYAKINSLTNSTYTVVWHPLEIKDAAKHWAQKTVNDMGSRMVIEGVGNNMFNPDGDITRGEFAAIAVKALGLKPIVGVSKFGDVESSKWYSSYVNCAAEHGIISGYINGKFNPDGRITREEAMVIIARAMKITGLNASLGATEADEILSVYEDEVDLAGYARDGVAACMKMGIVAGRNEKVIASKDNITRAEVASIVQRLLQKSGLI